MSENYTNDQSETSRQYWLRRFVRLQQAVRIAAAENPRDKVLQDLLLTAEDHE